MAIADEDLGALFSSENAHHVYVVQFADGTTEELTECQVWGDRECVATIVRTAVTDHSPGQAIRFGFDDVVGVRISERGFDHFR